MIDEILEELYRAGTHKMYCSEPHHFKSISNTEEALHAATIEALPKPNPKMSFPDYGLETISENEGFNKAIDQVKAALDELYGVKK